MAKKIIAVVLALAMIFTLAACGNIQLGEADKYQVAPNLTTYCKSDAGKGKVCYAALMEGGVVPLAATNKDSNGTLFVYQGNYFTMKEYIDDVILTTESGYERAQFFEGLAKLTSALDTTFQVYQTTAAQAETDYCAIARIERVIILIPSVNALGDNVETFIGEIKDAVNQANAAQ